MVPYSRYADTMPWLLGPLEEEVEETGDGPDDERRAGATDGADEADEESSSEEESDVSN